MAQEEDHKSQRGYASYPTCYLSVTVRVLEGVVCRVSEPKSSIKLSARLCTGVRY